MFFPKPQKDDDITHIRCYETNCLLNSCRVNPGGGPFCKLKYIEIGRDGRCMNFLERTPTILEGYWERSSGPMTDEERKKMAEEAVNVSSRH